MYDIRGEYNEKIKRRGKSTKKWISITNLIFIVGFILLTFNTAQAVKWPKHIVIAAPSAGTTNYMIAVGLGEIIKKYTPIKNVVIQPLGGPTVWGPMMKKGEIDFAIQSGADVTNLFLGTGAFEEMGPIPIRTAIGGHFYPLMFHTSPDKDISTIKDLKGKVVYTSMMGQPMFLQIAKAQLSAAGLTLDDLKLSTTMPSVAQAATDLIENRIDAFIYPVVPSKVQIINQAKGSCIFVNLTEKEADEVQDKNPGYFKAIIPEGRYANREEMKWAICFQTCLHVREDLDSEIVYEIVKVVLEHHDEWVGTHPQAKAWGLDKKPVTIAAEPYHEGAKKYYKEKKLWTDEVQKHNEKLMKRLEIKK